MNQSISFSDLGDGSWGVRVATKGTHPSPGEEVQVTKRDGTTTTIVLGAIVDRDPHAFPGPAVRYRKAKGNRRPKGYLSGAVNEVQVDDGLGHVHSVVVDTHLPKFGTEEFTWAPETKVFVIEASQLKGLPRGIEALVIGRFVLVSHKSGTPVEVTRASEVRDREGELQATVFEPADGKFEVHVLND